MKSGIFQGFCPEMTRILDFERICIIDYLWRMKLILILLPYHKPLQHL